MKPFSILLIISGLLICALSGCSNVSCRNSGAEIELLGFDSNALQKIIVKAYSRQSQLNELISKEEYILSGHFYVYDHINGYVTPSFNNRLNSDYDYIVIIPNASRQFTIRNMKEENERQSSGFGGIHDECYNAVIYYNLDGVDINTGQHAGSNYYAPLPAKIKLVR